MIPDILINVEAHIMGHAATFSLSFAFMSRENERGSRTRLVECLPFKENGLGSIPSAFKQPRADISVNVVR